MTRRDLARANMRIIAQRLRWPDGALAACERIEDEHPGWSVWWQHATPRKSEGWYAIHANSYHLEPAMYGATPDALRDAVAGHHCPAMDPPFAAWSWAR